MLLSIHLGISCLTPLNLHVALKILEQECFRKYQAKNNKVSFQLRFFVYINVSYLHLLEYVENVYEHMIYIEAIHLTLPPHIISVQVMSRSMFTSRVSWGEFKTKQKKPKQT